MGKIDVLINSMNYINKETMEMTSRQRVRYALEHKEADMIPIDFGAMRSTGINAKAYANLVSYLGLNEEPFRLYDIFQQLAEPQDSILKLFEADVLQLHRLYTSFNIRNERYKKGALKDGTPCLVPSEYNPVKNEKGDLELYEDGHIIAKMPADGFYFDVVHHPYADVTDTDGLKKIPLPVMDDFEAGWLKEQAIKLREKGDYAILGAFGGNIFEAGQSDWGYEKYFMNLALEPELMHAYHEKICTVGLESLKKYLAAVGEYIDVIQFGDDLGTQNNTQISVPMYREMVKPYHKALYQYVKKNYPHVKVFLHCCGSIIDLIPDLIDAGVEVLNPVQLSAKGMDARTLKREFGKDLTFWGGGISTQTTLTFSDMEDIKKEVENSIEIFAPGGGFVFTQIHNIQVNVAPEKMVAVYETAKKLRNYKK